MKAITLTGRILFSLIFLMSGFTHFSSQAAGYAAVSGVPMAGFLVPLSGVIAILGSLSIIAGYKAKIGGWLIVVFLVPVTFLMHAFWKVTDPMMMQMQMAMFMKNLAMIGGALYIARFGAGELSIDSRIESRKKSGNFAGKKEEEKVWKQAS